MTLSMAFGGLRHVPCQDKLASKLQSQQPLGYSQLHMLTSRTGPVQRLISSMLVTSTCDYQPVCQEDKKKCHLWGIRDIVCCLTNRMSSR